jgi:hypothetical protein
LTRYIRQTPASGAAGIGLTRLRSHRNGRDAMCEMCDDLKAKIEHSRRIVRNGLDALTIERIEQLISDYERQLLAVDCKDKA